MFKKLALISLLALGVSQAHAGFLIEPYLGYHTGEYEQGTTSEDLKGVTFGARAGYQQMGLMFGLDYMTGKWKDDASPSADVDPTTIGVFVGYNFPVMIRVYGVYGFKDEAKFKDASGTTKAEGDGSIKLGVGFTALPFVSINLEYMTATFDEADGQALGANEIKSKMYGLTVSLPLDL